MCTAWCLAIPMSAFIGAHARQTAAISPSGCYPVCSYVKPFHDENQKLVVIVSGNHSEGQGGLERGLQGPCTLHGVSGKPSFFLAVVQSWALQLLRA